MKIALYPKFSALNAKPVFNALIDHLKSKNEKIIIDQPNEDADVAVIWSVLWRGRMLDNKQIWDRYKAQNKPVIVLEVGGIKRNTTWKMGINHINRKADFANQTWDHTRWEKMGIDLQPWSQTGNVIVICGQHDTSHQWTGMPNMRKWTEQTVMQIRQFTQRPIIIRPHPRNDFTIDTDKWKHVRINKPIRDWATYDDTNFKKILQSTWAVVNHSSNPAMESVFNGIPVFVSEDSLCYDVGNHTFADIEHPAMPNRGNWASQLAYTEWTIDEIRNGEPWSRIRNRLQEKYLK